MEPVNVSYAEVKRHLAAGAQMKWIDADPEYMVFAIDPPFCCVAVVDKTSDDGQDFNNNLKADSLLSAGVITAEEQRDKDLKLANSSRLAITVADKVATAYVPVPGTFGDGVGRWVAGGYCLVGSFDQDCRLKVYVEDKDRVIAALLGGLTDDQIKAAGPIQQLGGLSMPNYPLVKSFTDDELPEPQQGWHAWPTPMGNSEAPMGEIEIEPLGGYAHCEAGLYLKMIVSCPNIVADTWFWADIFWGKKE